MRFVPGKRKRTGEEKRGGEELCQSGIKVSELRKLLIDGLHQTFGTVSSYILANRPVSLRNFTILLMSKLPLSASMSDSVGLLYSLLRIGA